MIIIMGDLNAKEAKEQDLLNVTAGQDLYIYTALESAMKEVTCELIGAQHITK